MICAQAKGKGGKNRRRGKNETEGDKRELVFKDEGQGECWRRRRRACMAAGARR
jgi:translation initiation factor 1A